MRNLKKMLSLVMALAMVASFMVVGASAAEFSDAKDIKNAEAVNTLVELNVINGRDTGAFDPTGIVTRGEMAKMITSVLNGGKVLNLGAVANPSFKDTANHWASGYIEYCANLKIVAGYGDGNFKPDATVTGSEAAKMLLAASGYNAAIEGFTGTNWSVATDVQANTVGLYEALTLNTAEGLTRDNAAQMVFNALSTKVVTYKYTLAPDGNGGFVSIPEKAFADAAGTKDITVLESKFGVVTVEGIVMANEYANLATGGSAMDEHETIINVTNHTDGQTVYTNGNKTFKVSSNLDVIGQNVTMFVKPSATSASTSSKGTVVGGVTASGNTVVVDYGRDDLATVAKDNKVSLKTTAPETQVSYNYNTPIDLTVAIRDAAGIRGQVRTLIDNDDDSVVDYVLYRTDALGKVTKYSTKDDGAITINGSSSLAYDDKADVVGFDDVKKGDYVLYAVYGGKLHVAKAEAVEGNLDSYNTNKTLTVDGTKYTTSDLAFYSDGGTLTSANSYASYDKDATFFLDHQGYVVAVDGTAASSNYAFLLKAATVGGVDSNIEVKVILDDGTTSTYTLDEDNSTGVTAATKNTICTYTLGDDKMIELKAVTATELDNKVAAIKKGNATVNFNGTSVGGYADANTVYAYVSAKDTALDVPYAPATKTIASDLVVGSSNVYVGKDNVPSLTTAATDMLVFTKNGVIKMAVVITDSVSGTSEYMYLYQKMGRNSDGYLYNAIIDGKLVEGIVVTTDAGLGLFSYSKTTKGFYKSLGGTGLSGNVLRIDGDSVIVDIAGTATEYSLTNNTIIANIDGGDTDVESVINEGDYISFKANTDKQIEAAYVELPYDSEQVAVTRNGTALPAGVDGFDVGEDKIVINVPSAGSITDTVANTLITMPTATAPNTITRAYADDTGTAISSGDSLVDGGTLTITFTTGGKTMVKVYDIEIIEAPAP